MTRTTVMLAAAALALAACAEGNDMTAPAPSGGGSVGGEGPGYCDSPPADMADMQTWEDQCMPASR